MNEQQRLARASLLVIALSLLISLCASTPAHGQGKQKSLYQRLGGYDAIAAVVDDFIKRLASDERFTKFFTGFSNDSKKRLRQHILDQFCAAAGGPCVYTKTHWIPPALAAWFDQLQPNRAHKPLLDTAGLQPAEFQF